MTTNMRTIKLKIRTKTNEYKEHKKEILTCVETHKSLTQITIDNVQNFIII